jgi:hypothetical protein
MDGTPPEVLSSACRSELMRIETRSGRRLGRLFDLRCSWAPGKAQPLIDEIVFGRVGLMERLGLKVHKPDSIPWSAVIEVRDGVLIVEDGGLAEKN